MRKHSAESNLKRKLSNIKTWSNKKLLEKHSKSLKKKWKNPQRIINGMKAIKAMNSKESLLKRSGIHHHNWSGGIETTDRGYKYKLAKWHPNRTKHGYVREHRLVVEQQIGRYLIKGEVVHHLGDVGDNRPHMLMAFSSDNAHKRFHKGKKVFEHEIIWDGRNH